MLATVGCRSLRLPKNKIWAQSSRPWAHIFCKSEAEPFMKYGLLCLRNAAKTLFGIGLCGPGQGGCVNADHSAAALNTQRAMLTKGRFTQCWPHAIRKMLTGKRKEVKGSAKQKDKFLAGGPVGLF